MRVMSPPYHRLSSRPRLGRDPIVKNRGALYASLIMAATTIGRFWLSNGIIAAGLAALAVSGFFGFLFAIVGYRRWRQGRWRWPYMS